jgi:hypothetical protein
MMIVVLVETPNRDQFFRAPQLAFDKTIIPAGTGLQLQSQLTVGPQLPFGAETMRGLDQGY